MLDVSEGRIRAVRYFGQVFYCLKANPTFIVPVDKRDNKLWQL